MRWIGCVVLFLTLSSLADVNVRVCTGILAPKKAVHNRLLALLEPRLVSIQWWNTDAAALKKELRRLLETFAFKRGITSTEARLLATRAYARAHRTYLPQWRSKKERIRALFETELLIQDFEEVAGSSGLLREDKGLRQSLLALKAHQPLVDTLIKSAALTSFLHFAFRQVGVVWFFPLLVHRLAILDIRQWSGNNRYNTWLELARHSRFDEAYLEIEPIISGRYTLDRLLSLSYPSFLGMTLLMEIPPLVTSLPIWNLFLKALFVTTASLNQTQEATFDPNVVRMQQLESQEEALEVLDNAFPELSPRSSAGETDKLILENTSPEDLRVKLESRNNLR